MRKINHVEVRYHGCKVGILAEDKTGLGAFQYDKEWLADGFSISPFSLPLESRVFVPKGDGLEGLFGVFTDSLPDGWGRLLVDRMLKREGMAPSSISAVCRLGIVGYTGMGALEYKPQLMPSEEYRDFDFDWLSLQCAKIWEEEDSEALDRLFYMGGSSGGARPKVFIKKNGEDWMVKFPSGYDRSSIGEEEYQYMLCAGKCGIKIPEIQLFPSKYGKGFFGIQRFDRIGEEKVHMVSAGGLLETSHRIPNLDYQDLMKLTYFLTRDERQLMELFRRMCFNVFAHNRDDHSKNFSYLYHNIDKKWVLSPAYDLTYSHSIGGEHATSVYGNGKDPGEEELILVGKSAGLSKRWMVKIIKEIEEIVFTELGDILKSYR